jgi:alpha-methylacyl-CoA racemase
VPDRNDLSAWPDLRTAFTARFKEKTQAEWTEVFEGTDACCAPVLPLTEAARHPHLAARETYVERDGVLQPAPAPRFSRTQASLGVGPTPPGARSREALTAWGIESVDALVEAGVVIQA